MKACDKNLDATYRINENIVFRLMDGEAVILDLACGEYFSLNKAGTKVLQAITHQKTIGEIIGIFCQDYGLKEVQARSDINDLFVQLKNAQIILEDKTNA